MRIANRGRFIPILGLVYLAAGCGSPISSGSTPEFTANAAKLVRVQSSDTSPCYGYKPPLNVSSYNRICLPFYDAHVIVMGIGSGSNMDPKGFAGMMRYASTEFEVVMSDGSKVRTSTDTEGFFALSIETQAELETLIVYPKDAPPLVCEPIDVDALPCR